MGEVQTENKDEAIGEDQARRGIWAWSKQTSSQPVFLYSAAGSSPEDELWSGSEEDSVYQQPGGRRSMDGDGMVGMLKWIWGMIQN